MTPAHTHIEELASLVSATDDTMQAFYSVVNALTGSVRDVMGSVLSVAVFGTAREGDRVPLVYEKVAELAEQIGRLLADRGLSILTGWCTGIPDGVERAFVARRNELGIDPRAQPRIGIHINLTDVATGHCLEDRPHDDADIYFKSPDFDSRMKLMLALSAFCIVFPGGIGSGLELFRYLQQQQLLNYTDGVERGVILVDSHFWHHQIEQLKVMVQYGTITQAEYDKLNLYVVDTIGEAREAMDTHLQKIGYQFPRAQLKIA